MIYNRQKYQEKSQSYLPSDNINVRITINESRMVQGENWRLKVLDFFMSSCLYEPVKPHVITTLKFSFLNCILISFILKLICFTGLFENKTFKCNQILIRIMVGLVYRCINLPNHVTLGFWEFKDNWTIIGFSMNKYLITHHYILLWSGGSVICKCWWYMLRRPAY